MNSDDSANLTGNISEVGRDGYDNKAIIYAFELGSVLLQSETLHNEAQLVAKYVGYIPHELNETFSIDKNHL